MGDGSGGRGWWEEVEREGIFILVVIITHLHMMRPSMYIAEYVIISS